MSSSRQRIWFWQRIVSPHMAGLACELARQGCEVTYVAEQVMSADRIKQGWAPPDLGGVQLKIVTSASSVQTLVRAAPAESIHICQGIRANGLVGEAQHALARRRLSQWIVMETVEDSDLKGIVKRFEYRRLFKARQNTLQGVLANGHRTVDWVVARGVPAQCVFPFAYFLPTPDLVVENTSRTPGPFRFIYVGQMIARKRVNWLINSLATLEKGSFELWLVGTGEREAALQELATKKLGDHVRWFGNLPMTQVQSVMAQADCLVLPSIHDGWGAVASEALMVGTPVICSDTCGVAGVIEASGTGGVFPAKDRAELQNLLGAQLAKGIVDVAVRNSLKKWASCLGAEAGAKYLQQILTSKADPQSVKIFAPWVCSNIPNLRACKSEN